MRFIYIAGPITAGDVAQNVRRAMELADDLIVAGYVPFTPHLFHFLHLHRPHAYGVWVDQGLAWLEQCDALVRLPGESPGSDREVERAILRRIPVVMIQPNDVGNQKCIDELRQHARRMEGSGLLGEMIP